VVGPEEAPLTAVARLRRDARRIVRRGVTAVSGDTLILRSLAELPADLRDAVVRGPIVVVAAGKAAVPMTRALLRSRAAPFPGLIAAPSGESPSAGLEFFRAGHPVPTEASVQAGRRALELAASLRPGTLLVVLLSGGASAALAAPAPGLTLEEKVEATRALLRSGVPIDGINCVRKHLSAVKGGRLAAAAPGRVLTLAISDVVGPVADDPAVIGSGPTVADPTTFDDALERANSRPASPCSGESAAPGRASPSRDSSSGFAARFPCRSCLPSRSVTASAAL